MILVCVCAVPLLQHLTLTQLTTPTCHINNMGKVKVSWFTHFMMSL